MHNCNVASVFTNRFNFSGCCSDKDFCNNQLSVMYDTSNYPDPHNNDAENNLFGLDGLDASTIYLIMGIMILCLFAAIITVIFFYKRQKQREKEQKNRLKKYDQSSIINISIFAMSLFHVLGLLMLNVSYL